MFLVDICVELFVSQQSSPNPLPWWLPLLVVPLLCVAVYVQFGREPAEPAGDVRAIPPVAAPVSRDLKRDSTGYSAPREKRGTTSTNTAGNTDKASPIPVVPDPEIARVAVHSVENTVYERATRLFEAEPVDVTWASDYEQQLRDMFARHYGLQRVSVNTINCHTSMCRIEVFTPRDADADFFTAMFYDGLANFREGALKAEAAITRRMEVGMTSVYVARKDYALGFY